MDLESIENKYGFRYPEKFRKIFESGAMEWITVGHDGFHSRKDEFMSDPKAFLLRVGGCELIGLDEFDEEIEYLYELIEMDREYSGLILKPGYRLVPFGFNGGGDKFCFVYEEGKDEPFIILFCHDDPDPEFYGDDFDEFIYFMILNEAYDRLYDGEDYKTEAWFAHLDYLSDKYRADLEKCDFSSAESVSSVFWDVICLKTPDIWEEMTNN